MTIAGVLRAHRTLKVISSVGFIVNVLRQFLREWMARRILARAISELQSLDDRMLADIGLKRSEIEIACRFGRRRIERSRSEAR